MSADACTVVNEGARLELLRALADYHDWWKREASTLLPRFVPLFHGGVEWSSSDEDMVLAAKEAAKLGQVEANPDPYGIFGYGLRITDPGYRLIRAHDAGAKVAP